jgi:hypothetical protein
VRRGVDVLVRKVLLGLGVLGFERRVWLLSVQRRMRGYPSMCKYVMFTWALFT